MTAASADRGLPASGYRPSGVSRFLAWVDGLPWHCWWLDPIAVGMLLGGRIGA